jgi:hypothetical protein
MTENKRFRAIQQYPYTLKDTIDGLSGTMAHMKDLCGDVE